MPRGRPRKSANGEIRIYKSGMEMEPDIPYYESRTTRGGRYEIIYHMRKSISGRENKDGISENYVTSTRLVSCLNPRTEKHKEAISRYRKAGVLI